MPNSEASDTSNRKLVWMMVGVMSLSFVFGIGMFVPAEHREAKLNEMMISYQARKPGSGQEAPEAKKRIRLE